jgi:predicted ATPase
MVLDNLEQLEAAAGQEIAGLLGSLPGLHVLATSRRLLDLDGEHTFELDGLTLPATDATLAEAANNPSVMLFVDRARAARAEFHLGAANVPDIVGLVRLLGGMPLAIELAASRVRLMTPSALLQRLSEGAGSPMLDLLARSSQRATPGSRHTSMRHVIDWSWRQLGPAQAALLGAMSVFAAPAQVEMVAAVAGLGLQATQALLDDLVDGCLVRANLAAQTPARYVLQQPVREFAAERSPPELARRAREGLRRWLIEFGIRASHLSPAHVDAEVPHVHAAIVGAAADGAGAQAVALAVALRSHWVADDLPPSSLLALQQGLADVTDPVMRVDAHELLAHGLANAAQMAPALTHAEAAVAGARLLADDGRLALSLARQVSVAYYAGQFDFDAAVRALDEATVCAQRSDDTLALATTLRVRALMVSNIQLDFAAAEALAARMQSLFEQVGNRGLARASLMNKVTMWAWMGRNEEAVPVLAQCEQAANEDGDWYGALSAARQTGRVLIRLRRWPEAAVALRRSVHVGWQRRHARGLANALLNLPEALVMQGSPRSAARLQGFALAHWARLFGAINRIETAEAKRTRRLLRLALGAQQAEALRQEGASMQLPAAVKLALDLDAN